MKSDPTDIIIIPEEEIISAYKRISPYIRRTPLIQLESNPNIYLKMENLQKTGSFKFRCALNAILTAPEEEIRNGVYTSSGGNFGIGLSAAAKLLNISCTVYVTKACPKAKTDMLEFYGGKVKKVDNDVWFNILQEKTSHLEDDGFFIHPASDAFVMAGNASIGKEVLEDLENIDHVIIPYGGGGLSSGIASSFRQKQKDQNSRTKVWACEISTATPLTTSRKLGYPIVRLEEWAPSICDGIGVQGIFPGAWNISNNVIDDTVIVTVEETREAMRLIFKETKAIVEASGATGLAAALKMQLSGNVVCIVTGRNLKRELVDELISTS